MKQKNIQDDYRILKQTQYIKILPKQFNRKKRQVRLSLITHFCILPINAASYLFTLEYKILPQIIGMTIILFLLLKMMTRQEDSSQILFFSKYEYFLIVLGILLIFQIRFVTVLWIIFHLQQYICLCFQQFKSQGIIQNVKILLVSLILLGGIGIMTLYLDQSIIFNIKIGFIPLVLFTVGRFSFLLVSLFKFIYSYQIKAEICSSLMELLKEIQYFLILIIPIYYAYISVSIRHIIIGWFLYTFILLVLKIFFQKQLAYELSSINSRYFRKNQKTFIQVNYQFVFLSQQKSDQFKQQCKICSAQNQNVIWYPCLHFVVCLNCTKKLITVNNYKCQQCFYQGQAIILLQRAKINLCLPLKKKKNENCYEQLQTKQLNDTLLENL